METRRGFFGKVAGFAAGIFSLPSLSSGALTKEEFEGNVKNALAVDQEIHDTATGLSLCRHCSPVPGDVFMHAESRELIVITRVDGSEVVCCIRGIGGTVAGDDRTNLGVLDHNAWVFVGRPV